MIVSGAILPSLTPTPSSRYHHTMPDPHNLTLKQRRFVQALPTAASLTDAALKAGYSPTGASATVSASQTVRKANVQAAIKAQADAANSDAIMSIRQRKARLTLLALPDPEHPDPMRAIDLLNRMEQVYVERTQSETVSVEIRVIEVVLSERSDADASA